MRAAWAVPLVLVLAGCGGGQPADRFGAAPDACALVPGPVATSVVSGATGKPGIGVPGKSNSCDWSFTAAEAARGQPYQRSLSVSATYYGSPAGQDQLTGTELAARTFQSMRTALGVGDAGSVPGLGEEAYRKFANGAEKVEFRKANVTVSISLGGVDLDAAGNSVPLPEEQARQSALTVATAAAAELDKAR
ncbi:hypothetical protein M8C13_43595 [Crossiella sp. SN42]|uniref:hypothetical protein n=1 Tax=Crossiella sp. SN42 TaxID=2944808 RepID=UPI00207D02A1|nr:hypothetical protein [Crossiella sp. SN42]MCO1582651.1 hypothetical protein [Crossiella sp. SN42]